MGLYDLKSLTCIFPFNVAVKNTFYLIAFVLTIYSLI